MRSPGALSDVAGVLVAADPRGCLDRTLALLVRDTKAAGGAVFAGSDPKDLMPAVVHELTLRRLAIAEALAARKRSDLCAGRSVRSIDGTVVPLKEGAHLAGLLFLDQAQDFDEERFKVFRVVLIAALLSRPTAAAINLASLHVDDLEREHLQQSLDANDWNISRVARLLGITRKTIYNRMERYGLQRKSPEPT